MRREHVSDAQCLLSQLRGCCGCHPLPHRESTQSCHSSQLGFSQGPWQELEGEGEGDFLVSWPLWCLGQSWWPELGFSSCRRGAEWCFGGLPDTGTVALGDALCSSDPRAIILCYSYLLPSTSPTGSKQPQTSLTSLISSKLPFLEATVVLFSFLGQ